MDLRLVPQLMRALRHPDRSVAHVRCNMDNIGDRLLGSAVTTLLEHMAVVDYSESPMVSLASMLRPRREFYRFTCLGGGTLIFADIDRGWGLALQGALRRTHAAFALGTAVIDLEFREDLHRRFGLRPLRPESTRRWVEILQGFELLSVRGPDSARMLREQGLDNVEVVGDPVLLYAYETIRPKAFERRIGININDRSYFFDNANERVVPQFATLIRRLRETGWTVTLYPMGPEDADATEAVLREVGASDIEVVDWRGPLLGLFERTAIQDVMIGVRLHSVAAAVCSYTPAIMVCYQPKNLEFMQSLGLDDHCVRIDTFDPDAVVALVENLYENMAAVQERQFAGCQNFKTKLYDFRERVYALAAR